MFWLHWSSLWGIEPLASACPRTRNITIGGFGIMGIIKTELPACSEKMKRDSIHDYRPVGGCFWGRMLTRSRT